MFNFGFSAYLPLIYFNLQNRFLKILNATTDHWDDFCGFLSTHDYVTNKLTCLVRDALAMEYIKVVVAVVVAFGIHLVSPFHACIISSKATH